MSDALFAALEAHDTERLAAVLRDGADADARHPSIAGWRALHAAIEELEDGGSLDALVLLLRARAHVDDPRDGDSPLLMALFRGQPEAARILLAAGADPATKGSEGDTPLRWVVEHGPRELAPLLLQCDAARTIGASGAPSGTTALGLAAGALDAEMIQLLLRHGADPAAPDGDYQTARDRLPPRTADNAERWEEAARLLGAGD